MERERGIPIGNLTSQILANIFLNEFDYYVKHVLKVKYYLRYGDDFIFIDPNFDVLKEKRKLAIKFLEEYLKLNINTKNNVVVTAKQGIHFLGVQIYPKGCRLSRRNWYRIKSRLNTKNYSSYWGLVQLYGNSRDRRFLDWKIAILNDSKRLF